MSQYVPPTTNSSVPSVGYGNITLGGGGGAGTSTVSVTGAGGGSVLMAGSSGSNWTTTAKTTMQGQLQLDGANPDIIINGKSMVTWMQKVEQRLSILEPKPELLAKYEALQQAYEHYKTLEALLHNEDKDA